MIKNTLAFIGGITVVYFMGKFVNLIIKIKVQNELEKYRRESTIA